MHIFVPVDNRMGLTFFGRRLSRDRALCTELLARCGDRPLLISPFSEALFSAEDHISLREDLLGTAQPGDFCFCENQALAPYEDQIEALTLCRWNRDYPSDRKLDLELSDWTLQDSRDIPGHSHETITLEVYAK